MCFGEGPRNDPFCQLVSALRGKGPWLKANSGVKVSSTPFTDEFLLIETPHSAPELS